MNKLNFIRSVCLCVRTCVFCQDYSTRWTIWTWIEHILTYIYIYTVIYIYKYICYTYITYICYTYINAFVYVCVCVRVIASVFFCGSVQMNKSNGIENFNCMPLPALAGDQSAEDGSSRLFGRGFFKRNQHWERSSWKGLVQSII